MFDPLPAGVAPVKDYPSLKVTLVECSHSVTVKLGPPPSLARCVICKGDEATTDNFEKPVKLMAVVSGDATLF